MPSQKNPILLRRAPLSGKVMALRRYTRKQVNGRDQIKASSKDDVNDDFESLMVEFLFGDADGSNDCPNIIGILDGVADGEAIEDDDRREVRAFRERFRELVVRHNERMEASRG